MTSPQLALVVGNVLAFLAGQRRGIRLAFVGRRQLTPTSWEFSFQPLTPLRYTPGQYIELTLPHEHRTRAAGAGCSASPRRPASSGRESRVRSQSLCDSRIGRQASSAPSSTSRPDNE